MIAAVARRIGPHWPIGPPRAMTLSVRVGCLHPPERDAPAALAEVLDEYEIRATERLDQLEAWLEEEQVGAVLCVVEPRAPDPAALAEFAARHALLPVIALVERRHLEADRVRELIADCCHDYHTLPLDPHRLRASLGHAIGLSQLWREREAARMPAPFHGMVGESAAMQALFRNLRRVAAVHAPVLIGGESGTGKELAARAVHRGSPVRDGPFVVVNCGALPGSLIAAELFGHERGAFTGATVQRAGRLEKAHGGTVFLDEVADLPLDLQSHLLRFLQEGTVDRIGGREPIVVRARVISATHVDLGEAVSAGRLREDLYYRLNVLGLHMPALRERREDVPLLARHFLSCMRAEQRLRCRGFTLHALQLMEQHDWPGNVRELINRVNRAAIMADGPLIGAAHLGLERRQKLRTGRLQTLDEARREGECAALWAALNAAGRNVSAAARYLGVSRVTLYRLMQRHGIRLGGADRPGTGRGAGASHEPAGTDAHAGGVGRG